MILQDARIPPPLMESAFAESAPLPGVWSQQSFADYNRLAALVLAVGDVSVVVFGILITPLIRFYEKRHSG